jgi:sortase (surface protein transpeptidase)
MRPGAFNELMSAVWNRKGPFLAVFFLVFILSYGALFAIDFVPEPPKHQENGEASASADREEAVTPPIYSTSAAAAEEDPLPTADSPLPISITIEPLGRTLPVVNPTSRAIVDLDNALSLGVVRHPDSATLRQKGTIFILGHSSHLPSVRNRYFQAFNGIENLVWGDTIRLRSAEAEYVYQVDNVYQARASEVTVPIAGTGSRLVLATCNSFGTIDDRHIVEAKLLYRQPLVP